MSPEDIPPPFRSPSTPFLAGGGLVVDDASDEELERLRGRVPALDEMATLRDWRLLSLRHGRGFRLLAEGVSDATGEWELAGPIVALDGLRRAMALDGRCYALGVRRLCGEGDEGLPDRVRRGIRSWGLLG